MKEDFLCLCLSLLGCSSEDSNNNNNNNNGNSQTVIADPAFEQALIDLGYDNIVDGRVNTSNIINVTDLVINDLGITSLSGIQAFESLVNLWANDNMLTSVNLNQNLNLKFIFVERNMLTELETTNLLDLEKIGANDNQLTSIDVANNQMLQQLVVKNNELEAINVSSNSQLTVLNVIGNPLDCILVNASQLTNIPLGWQKDDEDTYAITCN